MYRLNLKIYGRVQGIFFRASAEKKAKELGLSGWVKNADDGIVEIVAEGEKDKLNELKEWCKIGSELARVEKIEERWDNIDKIGFDSFEIVYN